MNDSRERGDPGRVEESDELSPREAALLVEQATRQARRQFDTAKPLAALAGASVFLFGYGAVWWSMRGQDPYSGPSGWSMAVLYGLIAVNAVIGGSVFRHAMAGVGGKAERRMRVQAAAVAAAGVGAWTFQGALRYLGVSFEIVYGVVGPTVPLMAMAGAVAGIAAVRETWVNLGVAITFILIPAVGTFFGPAGAWGLTGLGCGLVLVGYAVALSLRQRQVVTVRP